VEKAHRTQPWQAEEQERKAKHATKQNQPAARRLKQDSGGKEQKHSWGERGERERTGWVGRRKEQRGKKEIGKERKRVSTAPMDPPGRLEGAPS